MTSPDPHATPRVIHGGAMDRKIEAPAWRKHARFAAAAGGSALTLAIVIFLIAMPGGRTVKVAGTTVAVGDVTRGAFEDFVPIRGRVAPLKTVYLDAIEGGRIEKIYVEDGAEVKSGDVLVDLSNTQLRLEVLTREAEVAQQTNNVRTLELNLEQSRLNNRRDLIEAEYQVQKLGRALERRQKLFSDGHSSKADMENLEDEFNFQKKKFTLLSETLQNTERLQETQLKQIKDTAARLTENLEIARQNLDGLTVTAPVDGKLTAFNAEIGQSLAKGERLGQIDDPGRRKVAAEIDEFYLNRVELEQGAGLSWNGSDYVLKVQKIYPQVRDGHFVADLVFEGEEPADVRRGQTLQLKLTLGDATEAVLIPDGAFYQDTGGSWIFVVAPDGSEAQRRNVRLGRRNSRFIEVLDGLEPGEKVVTSPYTAFLEKDRLEIGG